MSVKVAIASSDGVNIDLHFGQAEAFLIYELKNGKFELTEKRELPEQVENGAGEPGASLGNESTREDAAFGGCGASGFACPGRGGFGCGGSGGGCGAGGASGPLAAAVELLLDCRAVVAAQIGQNMRRQFDRNAISLFDIEMPISEALEKLASYYIKFGEV
jgi:predicted Fe-Mo cluster-binding NifX family protein